MEAEKISLLMQEKKAIELFESYFGKHRETRTRRQWKRLVNQYGYEIVMKQDNLTKAQVKAKCKNA